MSILTPQQRQQQDELFQQEQAQRLRAFVAKGDERRRLNPTPPKGWHRPAYNTPEFWQAWGNGWISEAQAAEMEARAQRARASLGTSSAAPARWGRGEPNESRQYANAMATTAARDDRLTPQAKALLQVIRARCGNGIETNTDKTTLAAIMRRHVRSIQRYIQELARFGYVTAEIRRNGRGSHVGLIVRLCQKVLPFWKDDSGLAAWLHEVDRLPEPLAFGRDAGRRPNLYPSRQQAFDLTGRTEMSPNNYTPNLNLTIGRFAPLLAALWQRREGRAA